VTATGKSTPLPLRYRPVRRLAQLYAGLILYGVSVTLMVQARLGLDPWDVFHQGLSRRTGIRLGWVVIAVSGLVLLLWIPLRQRPGVGTLSNAVAIGLVMNVALALIPLAHGWPSRWAYLVAGIVANGAATGLYIGARLGPGPRDGLMTGLAARGWSIRVVRTAIEVTVLVTGWLLGGTVGWATVLYAVSIGPLAHVFIPLFSVRQPTPVPDPVSPAHPTRTSTATT